MLFNETAGFLSVICTCVLVCIFVSSSAQMEPVGAGSNVSYMVYIRQCALNAPLTYISVVIS